MCCIDLAAKVSASSKKTFEMPLHSSGRDEVIRRIGRRAGGNGGAKDRHNTPRNHQEGDFLLVPPLLFVGLLPLQGDALFGGPFLSWQEALSLTSPMSDAALTSPMLDAAALNVDMPPFALSGANPSLHARHEEQRFLFLMESFEWLHWWHSHNEARRVADCSVGISLREGETKMRDGDGQVAVGLDANLDKKIIEFLPMEFILTYIHNHQYHSEFSSPTSNGRKAKDRPSYLWWNHLQSSSVKMNVEMVPSYLQVLSELLSHFCVLS